MALNAHVASLKQMSEVEAAGQIALGTSNDLSLTDAINRVRSLQDPSSASSAATKFAY